MNALIPRDEKASPHAGPTSNVIPEAQGSHTRVSSDYVQKPHHHWFVLRVTYNRGLKAHNLLQATDVQSYTPMHYVVKKEIGKKKRILQPLLSKILFVYTTRQEADSLVKKQGDETPAVKYYLDKTQALESNNKHPPHIVPYSAMINFIKATSTDNEHVRIVSAEQCHYKMGDKVRVTEGDFSGVVDRVARIAGQQRVVVEISGLCLMATSYIPSVFLEAVDGKTEE